MPEYDEREALKSAITDGYWQRTGYRVTWEHIGPLMDAILASDWLAARDRENRAIGWDEGERHESEYLSEWGQFCPGEHCNPHRGDKQ